jgi:hypothetical protein
MISLIQRVCPESDGDKTESSTDLDVEEIPDAINDDDNHETPLSSKGTQGNSQKLKDTIERSRNAAKNLTSAKSSTKKTLMSTIKQEMLLFENGGNRGLYLTWILNAVLTVPPTSVESERGFSSAAYLCPKLCSSFGDLTLDALCRLRAHFQHLKKSHQK